MKIRNCVTKVTDNFIVAQRLKRTPSIQLKLSNTPKMKLSRMHDMAGCRVVLKDIDQVNIIHESLKRSRGKSKIVREYDYIQNPKDSGYRCLHLVYKYESTTNKSLSGLMVEAQIRTRIQHVWATGVEIVGTIINSPLKSNIGSEEWMRYFQIISRLMALQEHKLWNKLQKERALLIEELRELDQSLNALFTIGTYAQVIKHHESEKRRGVKSFLIHFSPKEGIAQVRGFHEKEQDAALDEYADLEKSVSSIDGDNVVLVQVDSIKQLRKAYPNYFGDTKGLYGSINKLIGNK